MGLPKICAALVCAVWFLMVLSCHAHDSTLKPKHETPGNTNRKALLDMTTLEINQETPENMKGQTPDDNTNHQTNDDYETPENPESKTPHDKTTHETNHDQDHDHETPENTKSTKSHDKTTHETNHKTPENTKSKTTHDKTTDESNHKSPKPETPKDSTPKGMPQDEPQDSPPEDSAPQDSPPQDSQSQDAPQSAPAPGPHNSPPQEWVDAHNAIRKPEGVVLMHWNESLAQYAENYVKKIAPNCKMEHSGGPYGECIFQGDGAATAKEIVDYWASEKQYYDVKSKKCADGQDCGHYLQVVNPNSPSLGCAKAKCANDVWYHVVICSYTW